MMTDARRLGSAVRTAIATATATATRHLWMLFVIGLAVSLVMVWRSQVGGDQLDILARGWLLAKHGVWIAYGNRTSAGGNEPGGLISLLTGLPLLVWSDYRAPTVVIAALSGVAYFLVDDVVARAGSAAQRILLAIVYWLNPWRLFFAGHLGNQNFLLFFGAAHLSTAYRMRHGPRFGISLLHCATLTFALQTHPSALILPIASALLLWRGRLAVHRLGACCGVAIGSITLIPYAIQAAADPSLLPGSGQGFIGRGLLLVFPLLRGILYWFRYSSFAVSEKIANLDFSPSVGAAAWAIEGPLSLLRYVAAPLSLAIAVAANLWVIQRLRRTLQVRSTLQLPWLRTYSAALFGAGVVSFCLSPTTVMPWQCLPFLHAAVLPVVLWGGLLWRTPARASVDLAMRTWFAVAVIFALAIAFGAPLYRSGGERSEAVPLQDHEILRDLGLAHQSTAALGVDDGARADVLSYE